MSYTHDHPMARLIAENYPLLQVMSRFGIKVGFGDKTVEEVCADNGVHTSTFLAVVNYTLYHYLPAETLQRLFSQGELEKCIVSLLQYLGQSHSYFLDFFLPSIRRKLQEGTGGLKSEVSLLIMKFFDDYTEEMSRHMNFEEEKVFSFAGKRLEGERMQVFRLSTYSEHHEEVASKLKELKRLIIKYCPEGADVNLLNAALYDIYRCEDELESHCRIEDHLFVPALQRLEKEVAGK